MCPLAEQRHMRGPSPKLRAGATLLIGVAGLGCYWFLPTVSVIVTFVATALAYFNVLSFNFTLTRTVLNATGLLHGAAVYLMTGSPWLGAAAALIGLPVPYPWVVRRWKDYGILMMPAFLATAVGLTIASAPIGAHSWPVAPAVAFLVLLNFVAAHIMYTVSQYPKLDSAARVGEPLVDIRLPNAEGAEQWDLADERGHWVLLAFLRGDWCPLCHVQMRVYRLNKALLEHHGVRLVVIATGFTAEHRDEAGVNYRLIEDPEGHVATRLGIVDPVDKHEGKPIAVPLSILIDGEGVVRYAPPPAAINAYVDPVKVIEFLEGIDDAPAGA
jgi:peroxiredoxin